MAGLIIDAPLRGLLDTVTDSLTPTPGRSVLAPGSEVAWDDCCDGQVHVRVITVEPNYPTAQRGNATVSGNCDPVAWSVTLGVGVIRCAAVLDDDGNAPAPHQITADARQMLDDMNTLAQALTCHTFPGLDRLALSTWNPSGPMGGCHGGEWLVTATVLSCACPEA